MSNYEESKTLTDIKQVNSIQVKETNKNQTISKALLLRNQSGELI